MARVLVLYYSSYGHTSKLAEAIAEGARNEGADVDVRHVPETAPQEVAEAMGYQKMEGHSEMSDPSGLKDYDAIIVGTPTRFGRVSSQMAAFWDRTGKLWQEGALVGKVGAAFTSTGSQHGGQETTLFSIITNLLHQGLTIVGLDYGFDGQMGVDEVKGGAPYGPTTIAGGDGSRAVSEVELEGGRYLGGKVARVAAKLAG